MPRYPEHLVRAVTLADGSKVTIRPIRAEDATIEQRFVRGLSERSRYFRFMDGTRELSPKMLEQFTRVDYDRHMALIAVTGAPGREEQVAVARYIRGEDPSRAEFAIVVGDAWQRKGLGRVLLEALTEAARSAGVRTLYGDVLSSNHAMLGLTARLDFRARVDMRDPRVVRVEKQL